MKEPKQLQLDLAPLPVFLVGCRVGGEIQHFYVEAVEFRQAMAIVANEVQGAKPILARVK